MSNSLLLPLYSQVKHFNGTGNFAIDKYYKFPFSFFYKKKLKMIIKYLEPNKVYHNILDFGSGKAEIFRTELKRHAESVKCVDIGYTLDYRWKFDVIVCASVLEFVYLPHTLRTLRGILNPKGLLLVSSPTSNILSKLYLWIIGDKSRRNDESDIIREIKCHFNIIEEHNWFGLYFSIKAVLK